MTFDMTPAFLNRIETLAGLMTTVPPTLLDISTFVGKINNLMLLLTVVQWDTANLYLLMIWVTVAGADTQTTEQGTHYVNK